MACCAACERTTMAGDLGDAPLIVWPSNVVDLKARLDPEFKATNATVQQCSKLSPGQRQAWDDFYASWLRWYQKDVGWFGSANEYAEGVTFGARLVAWQRQIKEACPLNAPEVTPGGTGPDASWVKWVAGAAIVIGVAYLASPLVTGARRLAK